eukprot:CAMPEP_0194422328 /NCGR_PEP_ID=MMETSP0176-20130528/21593_1 /TAXON_ID=216777 /ORGANISM="Proboscia alata, Strain PI-D3" /LENGTH=70 /DNA_ID=CAMNT_0039230941 /DNA_START=63 /DNA_END=272 /DNA_ORIENTATION=-
MSKNAKNDIEALKTKNMTLIDENKRLKRKIETASLSLKEADSIQEKLRRIEEDKIELEKKVKSLTYEMKR